MICYMPFSDIEDRFLDKLTAALGSVTIYCPSPGMASAHLLAAAREERLDLRCASGVQAEHLTRALQEFKAWADLHGGKMADLAGLSTSMQGRSSLTDETRPTSIGDQIRHFGEQNPQEAADPVFQAALFLAMAQQFDQQQIAVTRDMGEVLAMERVMLSRLAEDARDLKDGIAAAPTVDDVAGSPDTGAFMTERRVRSWAELVCRDTGPRDFVLYVTSSPAVVEHVLDHFEHIQGPLRIRLGRERDGAGGRNRETMEALASLSGAKDAAAVVADGLQAGSGEAHPDNLTIYTLAGVSPLDFPRHLSVSGNRMEPGPDSGQGGLNTLIGLMER